MKVHLQLILSVSILFMGCGGSNKDKANQESKSTDSTVVTIQDTMAAVKETVSEKFRDNITTEFCRGVLSILEDRKGNYWFGSQNSGAYCYDGKTLVRFTTKDGLFNDQVQDIQEDEMGNIWFTTGGYGVSCFDGKKITTLQNEQNTKFDGNSNIGWKVEPGDLWFNAGSGAYRFKSNSFSYLPFPKPNTDANYSPGPASQVGPYSIYSVLKDRKGNLWFGTQARGVGRYDGNSFTWLKDKGLAGPAVLSVFEDRFGKLWFGTNGGGLFCFDGQSLINFTEANGLGNAAFQKSGKQGPGTLARVWAINEDSSGNLWLGTGEGEAWRYDGRKLTKFTSSNGLSNSPIETIYKDRKEELWFGTNGDGLYKFNGQSFEKFQFPVEAVSKKTIGQK